MNEADTRAELIDPQLKAAGWGDVEGSRIQREYPIKDGQIKPGNIREGTLSADYVLIHKNRILAAVEAKSDEKKVREGVAQAKNYASNLELETTFAANGTSIYQICLKTGTEGKVSSFPTPDELWNKTFENHNDWNKAFDKVDFDDGGGIRQPRYYQELAINKALSAIANNKQRVLLTLATGTGKTFVASQISWKLFKSRWNLQRNGQRAPRILFLAHRNVLASQAYNDFNAFSESSKARIRPGEIRKKGRVPTNASVFFTIFQTFMSGKKDEPYFGQYPPDFFDLIIIDECHEGGANAESSWRGILDYFKPAVQLGLTATPKRKDNVDTYEYFNEPVHVYSLKQGINDGFLTPFKVRNTQTTMDEYIYSSEDEVLEGEVNPEKIYDISDFNKTMVIKERERKIVQELLRAINPKEKTIVFCANQPHAALIRDYINQESDDPSLDYCVRVCAWDGELGEMHLRNFQDNEKETPTILTTTRKLSTGVDAKNVRNIVLMRPINSMIEFKQIIGRGTRLYEGKNYFTVIDFVKAYHMFQDPDWDGEPVDPEESPTVPREPGEDPADPNEPTERPKQIKIKLRDGKEREIQTMSSTMFFVDGEMVGVKEFMEKLFDAWHLPEIFQSESKLRALWSNPETRRELLNTLEQEGISRENLTKLQEIIEAKDCDLFDVLEFICYAKPTITRRERVTNAESKIYSSLNEEQKIFIEFVLNNYVKDGVDELDDRKLGQLITLKYQTNKDAERRLGNLTEIRDIFIDFQKFLYLEETA